MRGYFNFLRAILDAETQSSDSATKIVKLPLSNIIHTLYVKVQATNGATSGRDVSIDDVVDKIEVVANGSDIIFSMTPREINRWAIWHGGQLPPEVRTEAASGVQSKIYPIMFGRMPLDPEYFLDCSRLSDLEVRITYSPTISATTFATGTTILSVLALMSMGGAPGNYRGTLCTKTLAALTSAASGDTQTSLPRGNLLRQLMVYAYETGVEPASNISRVKFDLNNKERVLCDLAWADLARINQYENWVAPELSMLALVADTNTIATGLSNIIAASVENGGSHDIANDVLYIVDADAIAGDKITIQSTAADVTAGGEDLTANATARSARVHVKGLGLPHAVVIDFSKAGEGELLNTNEYDALTLTLTHANADADVRISAQEVRVF